MTQSTIGSLVIVNANTLTPEIYWNGVKLTGISRLDIEHEYSNEAGEVKFRLSPDTNVTPEMIVNMQSAGIKIKVKP